MKCKKDTTQCWTCVESHNHSAMCDKYIYFENA